MNSFKIRNAKAKDLDWIVSCQIRMAKETEGFKLNPSTVKRGCKQVIQNSSLGKYWLVEDQNKKLVGMCLTIPEWSDWRCATVLWIHSVFVEPEYRGQGVYKKLYQGLQKQVQSSKKYTGLRLYVEKKNIKAQKVYSRLGMHNHHYELYEWMKDF